MGKICSFTGHRDIPMKEIKELEKNCRAAVRAQIENGARIFRTGGAVGFDMLAADAVLGLKKEFPETELHIYVPCLDQNKYYNETDKKKYLWQINQADRIFCVSKTYTKGCMLMRDRALVDDADRIICYLRKNAGGTAYTVDYAEKKGLEIIRL